ncbi:MAG: hypothetical protein OEV91_02645 [Desulfobulbaceae bacterium]|nr:hypothetical protein [Desulfobulbaceae bacterium]
MVKKISGAFSGGVFAALLDSINIQLLGHYGVIALFGVNFVPRLTMEWLYPRLVWGGIWGLLFMLPLLKNQLLLRGILFSLGPTMMVFLNYVPGLGRGIFGLSFGSLAPQLVLLLNVFWGIVAAFWYRESQR